MDEALLLCLAQTRVSDEAAARIQALAGDNVDWSHLCSLASRHGVVPLVYHNLSKICPEAVPRNITFFLRNYCNQLAHKNRRYQAELLCILDKFRACSLAVLPHKGPVLAVLAYGDLGLRSFSDLDLLVRSADIRKAYELMASLGYYAEGDVPQGRVASSDPVPGQYVFVHKEGRAIVEIHTELTLRYFPTGLDLDGLICRQRPVRLCGTEIQAICPEDMVLMLCVHGSKHFWDRLMWICDIAELVLNTCNMNWELVEERAIQLACKRMLFSGLYLANHLLHAPLPMGLLSRIQGNRAVHSIAVQIRKRLSQRIQVERGTIQRLLFRFNISDSPQAGARHCWRLAMRPTREELLEISSASTYFSMALRPLRLLFKHGL